MVTAFTVLCGVYGSSLERVPPMDGDLQNIFADLTQIPTGGVLCPLTSLKVRASPGCFQFPPLCCFKFLPSSVVTATLPPALPAQLQSNNPNLPYLTTTPPQSISVLPGEQVFLSSLVQVTTTSTISVVAARPPPPPTLVIS